nr:cobalamin biosynthesis protein CobQ [Bifidobacterium colobi]
MGLSTTAAMLAWMLAQRGHRCALIDADFASGCLDLLLGMEREPGLRFNQVDAPLGNIEGAALNDELIDWEGVRVLPCNPWLDRQPEWWEIQAVIRALGQANDVVVVDAGQGALVESLPDVQQGMHIMGVELSVVGLARARTHRAALAAWHCSEPRLIGIAPRGAPRGRGEVSIAEAEAYLACEMLGPLKPNTSLCGDVLEGLGIRTVPKNCRKAMTLLADAVEHTICQSKEGDDA